jgi:hypothetical protein
MRLPLAAVAAAASLVAPASADAGLAAREGTEIVYRSDPGQEDFFFAEAVEGTLHFRGRFARVIAGPGCSGEPVTCSLDGVTAIRLLADDGDDNVAVSGVLPVVADLGPGADEFIVGSQAGYPATLALALGEGDDSAEILAANVTVNAGPGNDHVDASVDQTLEKTGPARVEGGDGDDTVYLSGRTPGIVLSGGAGNDSLTVFAGVGHAPVDVACGPGDDRTALTPRDRPGDGCGPHVTGITPSTVSRAFREGRLTAAASGSVTLRRRVGDQGRPREIIMRGTFTTNAGPLSVSLRPMRIGRRWLRREPHLQVFVSIRTRAGGERGEVLFQSRLDR